MFFEFPMGGGGSSRTSAFNLGDIFGGADGGGFTFTSGMPGGFEMASPMRTIEAKHGWLLELPYKSCLYDILGICRDASEKDISKAYKKLAVRWHPDNNLGEEEEASKKFDIINKAYEFLKNPKTRRLYDSNRDDILRKQEEYKLSSEFNLGDRIALHSLTTTSYNGRIGHINKNFDMSRKRWPVILNSGDVKSFKASNIRLVSRFKKGDRVELHSLSTASYNQKRGTVECFNSDRGRWTINLDDGSVKTFKPSNLHLISEYTLGDRVVLHHLSTAVLNGKIATIYESFLTKKARWPVKLEDGSCRNIKPSNLRLATEVDEEVKTATVAAEVTSHQRTKKGEQDEQGEKMDIDDHTQPKGEDDKKAEEVNEDLLNNSTD